MATTNKENRINRLAADQALINGLNKRAATLSTFTVGGATLKTSDVIAALLAEIAAENAVAPARASWEAAVQAARTQTAKTKAIASGVTQSLQLIFKGQTEALADFGLKPRKQPAPRTPQQKAAAAAKAKATRAARNTMGSQQKKAVKGDVTGVTVTPVTAPAPQPVDKATSGTSATAAGAVTAGPVTAGAATTPAKPPS
ncbi:MAG: hypothetical protein ACRENE_07560 [Polyangiaceae bacterium]